MKIAPNVKDKQAEEIIKACGLVRVAVTHGKETEITKEE